MIGFWIISLNIKIRKIILYKMSTNIKIIQRNDFAAAFGIDVAQLHPEILHDIQSHDFTYQELSPQEREETILSILQHLNSDKPTVVGEHRAHIWESCWSDNLAKYTSDVSEKKNLTPDFIKSNRNIRYNKNYIKPISATFEKDVLKTVVKHLFYHYMVNYSTIYEFGCGSGDNLASIAETGVEKILIGMDWSASSNKLLNTIGQIKNCKLKGERFDFYHPNHDYELVENSAVFTVAALEQIGDDHTQLMQYFLSQKARVFVHLEPIIDFYDEGNLIDYLAILYHKKRNYLDKYLSALRAFEQLGIIKIQHAKRMQFGSLYHEAYNIIVWEII